MPTFSIGGQTQIPVDFSNIAPVSPNIGAAGGSPRDILDLLNSLKMKQAAQQYGFQSGLLGQQLAGQQALQAPQLKNALDLQANQLGETGREFNLSNELDKSRLGETGRQFDVGTTLTREQEAAKNRYLDELLNFERQKYGTGRADAFRDLLLQYQMPQIQAAQADILKDRAARYGQGEADAFNLEHGGGTWYNGRNVPMIVSRIPRR